MTKDLVDKILLRIVPFLVANIMRVWFASCKATVHNQEFFNTREAEGRPFVASFWHHCLVYILYYQRKSSGTAMVSASKDGDYIAGLANQLGFATARGSKNKNGMKALKDILKAVKSGNNAAIVADGSQGPALVAQPGALFVSSRTGKPVIPIAWSASKYFTISSWDRTIIPKPFSNIHYYYGEPISVPPGLNQDEIEEYRLLLEESLIELYKQAWNKFDKHSH